MAKTGHATCDITPMVPRICMTESKDQLSLFAMPRSRTLWSLEACYTKNRYWL